MLFAKRSFSVTASELIEHLEGNTARLQTTDIAAARLLAIHAGQLEQALADAELPSSVRTSQLAASAFVSALCFERVPLAVQTELASELERLSAAVNDAELTVRIPEGFAWYALFPDDYARTAVGWSRKHRASVESVAVIGIRSIGTTLAAVVSEVLRRDGFRTMSTTVRPQGDPFDRHVLFSYPSISADRYIIVDEGPGLSGSSFAAVARGLEQRGVESGRIDFFTGHGNGPGPMLNAVNRSWWSKDRVWCHEGLHPGLITDLSNAACRILGEPLSDELQPLQHDVHDRKAIPRAVAPSLATPKLVAKSRSGHRLVFRFRGLALAHSPSAPARSAHARVQRLASALFAKEPLGLVHGWLAEPWIDGQMPLAEEASSALVAHLADYLSCSPDDAVPKRELMSGSSSIVAALEAWSKLKGVQSPTSVVHHAARTADESGNAKFPLSFDGRMAPHKWCYAGPRGLLKIDTAGHDCDHTWVGRQPIMWDIAACEIEWELAPQLQHVLREAVAKNCQVRLDPHHMTFYRAGYAAFRTAAARHCSLVCEPSAAYLESAEWYDSRIEEELHALTSSGAQ